MTESCIKAHENGQRAWTNGKLRDAQQHFLACSTSSCPALVEDDCMKWTAQLREIVPTVVIDARDADGQDIDGDVDVLIDDQVVTHTIDGKGIPVDPGSHVIVVRKGDAHGKASIVAKAGMKSRLVTIQVISHRPPPPPPPVGGVARVESTNVEVIKPSPSPHSVVPWIFVGLGSAIVIGGVIVFATAPELSERQDTADRSASMPAIGVGLIAVGSVIAVGGLLWHFLEPTPPSSSRSIAFDASGIRGRF